MDPALTPPLSPHSVVWHLGRQGTHSRQERSLYQPPSQLAERHSAQTGKALETRQQAARATPAPMLSIISFDHSRLFKLNAKVLHAKL